MPIDRKAVIERLNGSDFPALFTQELGWDWFTSPLSVQVGETSYILQGIAEKRGVQIFECRAEGGNRIPDYNIRKKIEKQVTKAAYEHLIIFTDPERTVQIWQWVARAPGRPDAYREISYRPAAQSGELLLQKLQAIRFTLAEEESIDIVGASHRLRDAFDRDTVTRKFYNRFKTEQQAFLGFIEGIADAADRKWYASLMLNRLMFVWFIQQKSFLDDDRSYLQNRLVRVRERKGTDRFHTFYRYFLLALFHEGFGKREQDRDLDAELMTLLGRIPYLNGGLFDPHRIEDDNEGIQIPDEAFERLFAFFSEYDWHLDTRTISQDNEINPDVLGYIFEKYINQKQMGAYYTKEDITEYISKNTILPFLFDTAKKKYAAAFQADSALWRMLQDDPDAFIYPAMRKGVLDAEGTVIPLPADIEEGVDTTAPNLLERRRGWNAEAAPEYALPTEIWREHVARRQRCLEIREILREGGIHEINDLITYNLDIRQFAERAISECDAPKLLREFWQAIRTVTILDPTCGSGAFLFAALEILYPLYDACLTRMQGFVDDLDRSGETHSPRKFADFRDVLADIDRHPSRDYFILKSIIVHNLYGVDIMPEAVEICKLRLFLKLVAQVDRVDQLEPLPDIDFNIRAGNTLVGFTSMEEIRKALSGDLIKQLELPEIEEQAENAAHAYALFHEMQTRHGMDSREFTDAKHTLREQLTALEQRLNVYLAESEYGIDANKPKKFDVWVKSHQPFHWLVEFYGIVEGGGFDVIIGNPPYVEYRKVRNKYTIHGYKTHQCDNLWAFVVERVAAIGSHNYWMSLIVPLSLVSASKMSPALRLLTPGNGYSSFLCLSGDAHPCVLFDGVKMSYCIFTRGAGRNANAHTCVSKLYRWLADERQDLFDVVAYTDTMPEKICSVLPKLGCTRSRRAFEKILQRGDTIAAHITPSSKHRMLYHRIVRHFVKCLNRQPFFSNERDGTKKSEDYKVVSFPDSNTAELCRSLLVSNCFYLFFNALSDSYHCGRELVLRFPTGLNVLSPDSSETLRKLGETYEMDLYAHAKRRRIRYRTTGWIEYDEFYPRSSKRLGDHIDQALAKHYGFTEEELDFIINYDIKYRMGDALNEEDD